MIKELEDARKIFLADDIDEEVREENAEQIQEWEQSLIKNQAYQDWRDHDITKEIAQKAKITYRELAIVLHSDRSLTDAQRRALWAKQDAIIWLLSITEFDAKGAIESLKNEIATRLANER